MQFHIITLMFDPLLGDFDTAELDSFCAAHHIYYHQCACFRVNEQVYWTVWLSSKPMELSEPLPSNLRTDKIINQLTKEQQKCLEALRQWRNELALKEGFPPYIIASNDLLHQIVLIHPQTQSELLSIRGFGKKKVSKYGKAILDILKLYPSS